MCNGRKRLAALLLIVGSLFSACAVAQRTPTLSLATPTATPITTCAHPESADLGQFDSVAGGYEIQGNITQGTPGSQFWVVFEPTILPLRAETPVKIRWKVPSASSSLVAIGPDGQQVAPQSPPEYHTSSSWSRPGDEFGALWIFPTGGCWDLHAAGGMTGDVFVTINPAFACIPAPPTRTLSVGEEIQGTAIGSGPNAPPLFAMVTSSWPPTANTNTTIELRLPGTDDPRLQVFGPSGEYLQPQLTTHTTAGWTRPGHEWTMTVTFPASGCWELKVVQPSSLSGNVALVVA